MRVKTKNHKNTKLKKNTVGDLLENKNFRNNQNYILGKKEKRSNKLYFYLGFNVSEYNNILFGRKTILYRNILIYIIIFIFSIASFADSVNGETALLWAFGIFIIITGMITILSRGSGAVIKRSYYRFQEDKLISAKAGSYMLGTKYIVFNKEGRKKINNITKF